MKGLEGTETLLMGIIIISGEVRE